MFLFLFLFLLVYLSPAFQIVSGQITEFQSLAVYLGERVTKQEVIFISIYFHFYIILFLFAFFIFQLSISFNYPFILLLCIYLRIIFNNITIIFVLPNYEFYFTLLFVYLLFFRVSLVRVLLLDLCRVPGRAGGRTIKDFSFRFVCQSVLVFPLFIILYWFLFFLIFLVFFLLYFDFCF